MLSSLFILKIAGENLAFLRKICYTIAMNIYTEAFTRNNYGLGSAKAMLFFAAVLIVAQLQVFVTSKQEVQA